MCIRLGGLKSIDPATSELSYVLVSFAGTSRMCEMCGKLLLSAAIDGKRDEAK